MSRHTHTCVLLASDRADLGILWGTGGIWSWGLLSDLLQRSRKAQPAWGLGSGARAVAESGVAGLAQAARVRASKASLWMCLTSASVLTTHACSPVSGFRAPRQNGEFSTNHAYFLFLSLFSPRVTFLPMWTEDQPLSRENRKNILLLLSTIMTLGTMTFTRTPTGRWAPLPCLMLWEEL